VVELKLSWAGWQPALQVGVSYGVTCGGIYGVGVVGFGGVGAAGVET
jgi:hypothetical protein